ncbi:PLP-dependent transferase, partial [Bifidobacterium sp. 64T4]|uniref:trans-sulfuration enzyme family protein n=1 Tax=Bifidobacterium pongonis TaxID=2834432 RepID=UPI001C59FD2A
VNVEAVDTADYKALDAAVAGRDGEEAAKAVYFEVLTNPLLQVNNVSRISEVAHRHGALSIVDNTFVTPYLQQPLDLGADIVIHSATKYLAGHSEVNAGLVVVADDVLGERIYYSQNRLGGVLAPAECDSVRRGIQTLALRLDRQQENALAIADYLLAHPLVKTVNYPGVRGDRDAILRDNGLKGFGGVLSFEVVPGVDPAIILNNLHVFHLAVSLGAVESLAELPCRMTHFELPREERLKVGISDELIRLAVGIEDKQDLIEDLGQAFELAYTEYLEEHEDLQALGKLSV